MKVSLIDGSAMIYRAFHSYPRMERGGRPCNAIYGACQVLWARRSTDPDLTHMAVVLDAGRSGRDTIQPGYKGNRGPRDPDLQSQMEMLPQICEAFSIPVAVLAGYEADDVIATIAKMVEAAGGMTMIYANDKDLMQLVSGQTFVFDTGTKRLLGVPDVTAKWGVRPDQIGDVLALMGDAVDNIPGIPGIGLKTATALVAKYGTLDALIAAAQSDKIIPSKLNRLIASRMPTLRISKRLVSLICNAPMPGIERLQLEPLDERRLSRFLSEMEFDTMAQNIMGSAA